MADATSLPHVITNELRGAVLGVDTTGPESRESVYSEDNRGFHLSSFGFLYGDSGMKLRSLVFLCFGANTTSCLSLF